MRIRLDAKVRTKDGHRAGRVKKVLWDPRANEINSFIIGTGGLLGHDVLISPDVLEKATVDGDEIVVDLTKQELERLETYDESIHVPAPVGWPAPVMYDYPSAAYVLAASDPIAAEPTTPHDVHEHRRPEFRRGMHVRDASGNDVGTVDEIRVEEATGEVRALVVRDGESAREVAVDQLDIGGDEVRLIGDAPRVEGHDRDR